MTLLIPAAEATGFASRLVRWQFEHGRHGLPWQNTRDPYRVWLSEIMLQQTQVSAVLPYFGKFLEHFPTVEKLAVASQDDVLGLWSGLGYYSRARNLHRCAQAVVEEYSGRFPKSASQLIRLPGIGPSTAAAIASICFDERVSILDGNVKRVVSRYLGFDLDLSITRNERALWALADTLLPEEEHASDMPVYTQALMDLGATVCTRSRPNCDACPLKLDCVALAKKQTGVLPLKTKKVKRSSEAHWMLVAVTTVGDVMLAKRPQAGIWAGLYAFPMFESYDELLQYLPADQRALAHAVDSFVHVLTHKDLHLHPVMFQTESRWTSTVSTQWYTRDQWPPMGLPQPVRKLLESGR